MMTPGYLRRAPAWYVIGNFLTIYFNTLQNMLKLPAYSSKEKLKEKLLAAITSGARFEIT